MEAWCLGSHGGLPLHPTKLQLKIITSIAGKSLLINQNPQFQQLANTNWSDGKRQKEKRIGWEGEMITHAKPRWMAEKQLLWIVKLKRWTMEADGTLGLLES